MLQIFQFIILGGLISHTQCIFNKTVILYLDYSTPYTNSVNNTLEYILQFSKENATSMEVCIYFFFVSAVEILIYRLYLIYIRYSYTLRSVQI